MHILYEIILITPTAVTAQLSDTMSRLCFIINTKMHEGYLVALLIL